MATVFRAAGAIVAAMMVAIVLVVAVEMFSAVVHPIPADFDGSMEQMCQHVAHYPNWVLAVAVPAWAGTVLTSTWIAGRVGNRGCAILVGLLLVTAVAWNVSMLPYPVWFKVACLIAIPAAAAAGGYLSAGPRVAAINNAG